MVLSQIFNEARKNPHRQQCTSPGSLSGLIFYAAKPIPAGA
jgi:hypothetical protein